MNLEENNNFFRESFKGFNKDDVAAFIAKLSNDYTENEKKYKEHIAKLTVDNKAKTDEINRLNAELADLSRRGGSSLSNYAPPSEGYISPEHLGEIERKYKEELDKLSTEIYEKDQRINNFTRSLTDVSESEKKYREEMNNLIDEIHEKNTLIEELRKSSSATVLAAPVPIITSDEIDSLKEKYTEVLRVNQDLHRKIEENEKKLREAAILNPDMANQLSAQLAISESEKLFLIGMLKKIVNSLDITSVNMENVTKISQIPESTLQDIENKISSLSHYKSNSTDYQREKDGFIMQITDLKQQLERASQQQLQQQPVVTPVAPSEQKMYEAITAELGGIVYSAKKSAEEIVAKAKNESEDIIARANMKRLSILEENERHISDFKEKYMTIKKEHETIILKYKEMSDRYTMRLSEVEDAIDSICNNI